MTGIAGITTVERAVRARANDGAGVAPALLAALNAADIPVAAVTVAHPSLDDVYLRYAGREFGSAIPEGA